MTSHMTSKLSVNIVYFFANFVLLHSFLRVGQGKCFPIYLPKFFLRSFQRSFENCAPFLKIFFGRSSQILPKTFSKKVSKIHILSLEKKSSKDLPKKFKNLAPGRQINNDVLLLPARRNTQVTADFVTDFL